MYAFSILGEKNYGKCFTISFGGVRDFKMIYEWSNMFF